MAKDLADAVGTALGKLARETLQTVSANAKKGGDGPFSGAKGVAAGAGLAAMAPLAVKGAGKMVRRGLAGGVDTIKDAGEDLLPGGNGNGKSTGVPGVGKGRRMPVQMSIDVGVPIKTAYNQWTQFEDWPKFMHRLERVTQEDETHVSFKTKIWGISKEFKAEIVEQRPDERIKWRVTEGVSHTGVITFHELADRLTHIEVNIDVHPDSLIEKAARGMRHVKRAVRADLARYKAYVMMEEDETGAWRGVIDDGEVKPRRKSSSSSGGGSRKKPSTARSRSSSASRSGSSGTSNSKSRTSASRSRASSNGSGGSGSTRKKAGSTS